MAQTAGRALMRPKEPATGEHDGEPFVINPRELFDADHPLVRAYPGLFTEADPTRPDVEQMTAAPGEKRGAQRRTAAK